MKPNTSITDKPNMQMKITTKSKQTKSAPARDRSIRMKKEKIDRNNNFIRPQDLILKGVSRC
jgi:hypothetical protein